MVISALVVTYEAERELAHCLQSLRDAGRELEPMGRSLEVVLADNGSGDGTLPLVRERFPEVRLLELGRNLGFGAANNRAAAEAKGDLLLLLNPDAWLAAGSLPRLIQRLEAEPGAGLVAPRFRAPAGERQFDWVPDIGVVGEVVQRMRHRAGRGRLNVEAVPRALQSVGIQGWYTAACLLVRRTAFEAVEGFDEGFFLYFEDVDLCVRLRQAGWELALEPEALAYHVGSSGRRTRPRRERERHERVELEYRRGQLRYYRKHRPRWEQWVLRRHLARKYRRIEGRDEFRRRLLAELE
ncbi:MAG TPA: glycosyltransferase family 2 protein [Thermoanaerobaculia bacterium]|nr:glycosyltransferase family 2 protein [Thermoanaerobaculia bacterium]